MTPDKIKNQLVDYYQQFRANLGSFKSFEIIFNYINFIKSEPYLNGLLKHDLKYADEQIALMIDSTNDQEKSAKIDDYSFSLTSPINLSGFPIFNQYFCLVQKNLEAKKSLPLMTSLPIHLTCLMAIAAGFQRIKDCQSAGDDKEAQRLIETINEESFSIVNVNNIEGLKPTALMSSHVVGTAIEMVNKYIFDHIDSQSFLDNDKPLKPLDFNKRTSILYIHGRAIKITLKNNPPVDHHILEALFQNDDLSEKAYFSEIAKDFDKEEYNGNWQRYRHACENLNQKIAKATNNKINDLIDFTTGITGWCRINPNYL